MRHGLASLVSFFLALLAGPASADLDEIVARGVLRVIALEEEQPELLRHGATENPGFYRELIDGFAHLHKLRVELVPVAVFGERIPALLDGRGDVVVGLIATPERREQVDFGVEVLPAYHLVVNCAPTSPIEEVEQFRQEKVGVIPGSSWAQAAAEGGVPASEALSFSNTEELLQALERGEISATVMSVSDFTLAQKRHPRIQGGVTVGGRSIDAWGIRKSDGALKAAVDDYLSNVRRTPTWSRLVVKYFGEKALSVLKGNK